MGLPEPRGVSQGPGPRPFDQPKGSAPQDQLGSDLPSRGNVGGLTGLGRVSSLSASGTWISAGPASLVRRRSGHFRKDLDLGPRQGLPRDSEAVPNALLHKLHHLSGHLWQVCEVAVHGPRAH